MYEIKLANNNEEVVINAVSTDAEAPRLINAKIKHAINSIDSLSFTITPNNPGYASINALTTLVEVLNTRNNKVEFKGRILLPLDKMDSSGLLSKSVTCESELGYLMDTTTVYGEYHNISVRDFLQVIISNHNSQVSAEKRFILGTVNVIDNNDSLYRFLGYTKTLDAIKDKLINRLGGELQVRYENGNRYLDYLTSIGETKETDIRLSKNLETIEQEKNPLSVISRLIPLGAKMEDSEDRLTISSVNGGSIFIDDSAAINEFGVIVRTVQFDDVNVPSILLSKGQSYLSENNKIKKRYKISALDLSIIGLDFDSFEVGNTYPVINPIMNIDENLRIIEKDVDCNNPQNSNLTFGEKFEDIKQYQLGVITANKNIVALSENLNSTIDVVNTVSTELNNTAQVVNDTNVVLANTNQTVADLTQTIANINLALQSNINTTQTLANSVSTIQNTLTNTNSKLEKLKRRAMMEVY